VPSVREMDVGPMADWGRRSHSRGRVSGDRGATSRGGVPAAEGFNLAPLGVGLATAT
jgi:hypothetical protein